VLVFGAVDLSGLVADMLVLLKVSISKRATLHTNLCQHLRAVWGNATQIRQIVMNLIINASQAIGEKDGVISVSTLRAAGGRHHFVRLEISDTGCGMTEEEKARIFDPFFTTKPGGHGLGLAVVHGIVNSHGGAINVTSTPGKGTMFEVLLPCVETSTEPASPALFATAADAIRGASAF
jgi:signal transduction histidine kinase